MIVRITKLTTTKTLFLTWFFLLKIKRNFRGKTFLSIIREHFRNQPAF